MNTYFGQLIISSLLVASVSFIGMVLVRIHPRIRHLVERGGELLNSFSAGIFLVTSFFLAKKALASTQDVKMLALSFTLGVFIYFLLHRLSVMVTEKSERISGGRLPCGRCSLETLFTILLTDSFSLLPLELAPCSDLVPLLYHRS